MGAKGPQIYMSKKNDLITFGIETSCDETSVGLVRNGSEVLCSIISSQVKVHQEYGGVVPEMASRLHVQNAIPVIREAFNKAGISYDDVSLISYTKGPGLLGALSVGVMIAKTLSFALNKPLIGVNHIEGHIYANRLEDKHDFQYPVLALIVSGGHTQLILIKDEFQYELIGNTLDDAIGEAFDKSGRLLGLGYPGGPMIDKLSQNGSEKAFRFPQVRTDNPFDFSFSGLKTAVLKIVTEKKLNEMPKDSQAVEDFCASLQYKLVDEVLKRTKKAAKMYSVKQILVAGGVSANSELRKRILELNKEYEIAIPQIGYCLDNGAMIAAAGYARYQKGFKTKLDDIPSANLSIFKELSEQGR